MISLAKVLSGKPVLLKANLYFYQPTLQEIEDMTEATYWGALNIWIIDRKELIETETPETEKLDDFELWKGAIFANQSIKRMLGLSCMIFLKSKVEFFDVSNTIYIGDKESGMILDNTFYLFMRELCQKLIPNRSKADKAKQYQETDKMSEREKEMIAKMKKTQELLDSSKAKDRPPEDYLGNRITALVAIGHYTFDQVYNMTMLQFNLLLEKYVEIQNFEIRSMLSPYVSSDNGSEVEFWLY